MREVLGDVLAWIGPVYRLGGGRRGRSGAARWCATAARAFWCFRSGSRIRWAARSRRRPAGKVAEDKKRSKHLNGFRYFVIDNPAKVNAYQLRDLLLEGQRDQVADVRLENMPMLVPTAAIPEWHFLWAQQWNMARIQAPAGWHISTGRRRVVVCVLDVGCDLKHPDLAFAGKGINLGTMSGNGSPTGPSHGTACAGIAAAIFKNGVGVAGVAGACRILPVAFGTWTDVEVAAGITWATTHGAKVINMSFGAVQPWDTAIIDPAIRPLSPRPGHVRRDAQ